MFSIPRNVVLLLFLYFIQGLPYGIQVQFLPIYLKEKKIDLTSITLLRLLQIPWFCKPLWAPLVDNFGTKKRWLLGSIFGVLVTCVLAAVCDVSHMTLLCTVLLCMNVFVASQDIAVDSIAMRLLSSDELGEGNTAQVVGYKIGSVFGGGVIVSFIDFIGWGGLFLAVAALYLEAFLFVAVSPALRDFNSSDASSTSKKDLAENSGKDKADKYTNFDFLSLDTESEGEEISEAGAYQQESYNAQSTEWKDNEHDTSRHAKLASDSRDLPLPDVLPSDLRHRKKTGKEYGERPRNTQTAEGRVRVGGKVFQKLQAFIYAIRDYFQQFVMVPGTLWLIVYLMVYKLGEQGALSMIPLLLVDMDLSVAEVTFWNGIMGQAMSISGSLLGGWLVAQQRFPVAMLLQQFSLLRLLPLGAQTLIIISWHQGHMLDKVYTYLFIFTLLLLLILSGMITTATFTCMMQCSRASPLNIQATHYSMLATFEVVGKLGFTAITGYLTDLFGYPFSFLLYILLSAAVLPLFGVDSAFTSEWNFASVDSEENTGGGGGENEEIETSSEDVGDWDTDPQQCLDLEGEEHIYDDYMDDDEDDDDDESGYDAQNV